MTEKTAARISEIVEQVAMRPVAPDEPLLEGNLIDSISAVDIALQIEKEMQVTFTPYEVTEHMKTLRSLVDFVLQNHKAP
jgi:acyl carrier protein